MKKENQQMISRKEYDALVRRIEALENHQHTYWGPRGLAGRPLTTQPQRDTGAAAHATYLKQQADKKKAKS
jgi:hypothetical protein